MALDNGFVHHVFFWLNNPESTADLEALVAGLKKLAPVSTVRQINIGTPAATRRPVIDHSYSASLLLVFDDQAAHDAYQVDPIHLEFVETCKHLWSRVQIYDSEATD